MTDARYARYARNQVAITEEEQLLLGRKRVVIVGCGGLGVFALRGLFMKIGTSLAGLLFPTVILWGTEDVNVFGIRMTGIFGIVFCFIGLIFIAQYKDYFYKKTQKNQS